MQKGKRREKILFDNIKTDEKIKKTNKKIRIKHL